jgi:hypothetical protein
MEMATMNAPLPAAVEVAARAVRLVREGDTPRASCPHCGGELAVATTGSRWKVARPADVADRLAVQLGTLEREVLEVLLLNTRNVVVGQVRVYEGNVSASLVRVGELFTEAIRRQAASVILVHCHPSGDPTPSPDDIALTADAIAAGRLLDVPVLDHIIVGGGRWTSLRAAGALFDGGGRRPRVAEGPGGDMPDGAADALARLEPLWVTAKSGVGDDGMAPHDYLVFGRADRAVPRGMDDPANREAVSVLLELIRRHPDSFNAYYRGYVRPNRYLEIGEYRYWRTRLGGTDMLNRCSLDSVEPPRRVDQGAKPIPWGEDVPPWAPYGTKGWVKRGNGWYRDDSE